MFTFKVVCFLAVLVVGVVTFRITQQPVVAVGDTDKPTKNQSRFGKTVAIGTTTSSGDAEAREIIRDRRRSVVDGIFWTKEIENMVPKGIKPYEAREIIRGGRIGRVASLEPATSRRCGRFPNAVARTRSNETFCAKYHPTHNNHSLFGELVSFHLSQLLRLDNVAPTFLSRVTMTSHSTWDDVRQVITSDLLWPRDAFVVLIGWILGLEGNSSQVTVPPLVAWALKNGIKIDRNIVDELFNCSCATITSGCTCADNVREVTLIYQWGSMVVFDYITANYDRVARVDSESTIGSVRNLLRSSNGRLWLLDNEASFLRSYRLIRQGAETGRRLQTTLLRHLQTTCVFQSSLVQRLVELNRTGNAAVGQRLIQYVRMREPLFTEVTIDADDYELFADMLGMRISDVLEWIDHCQSVFDKEE